MRETLSALYLALLLAPACAPAGSSDSVTNDGESQRPSEPERWLVEVLDRRPHDPGAYTQGLLWRDGVIYESTGSYGASSLRSWRWDDGSELARVDLDGDLFGEGIALVPGADERLVQLTWRRGVALVWSVEPFAEVSRMRFDGEGWGLAYDGSDLIMSDGTPILSFRDPETLTVRRRLRVTRSGMPVDDLNELELVDDLLFANLFGSDEIAVVDMDSGSVVAIVDASGLLTAEEAEDADVLNGIAYRPDTGTFLLTGKYWPWVFEVRIVGYDPPPLAQ
ncbi:MAG: glutaminyl-peptide cyclotransferase [Holophagales bacterium]|nr:glutaminyl-peptide cyclotransferase [Holophagales bacterium]MXX60790.1 glutaminyl-peptide cyclotransferase [Holophagales bacterium]MYC11195.1 glutaminyl-peptide cyclotransferase [Holophagales bacterium]MYD22510.1 glutaminyl-peptide cyclotransferase [Holophagales bacterium]MYI34026.1 glutaminyl-peptide cyclotransferase [Holophagales bacterium]